MSMWQRVGTSRRTLLDGPEGDAGAAHGVDMSDWVAVLEAAYRLDGDDETWLSGVLAAAAPTMLAKPERSYAFTYDATNPGAMRMETVVTRNFPPGKGRKEIEYSQAGLAAADVEQSFGRTPCATASQLFGEGFRDKLRFPHFEA